MKKSLILVFTLLAPITLYSCNSNDIKSDKASLENSSTSSSDNSSTSSSTIEMTQDDSLLKKHEIVIHTGELYSVDYLVNSSKYFPTEMEFEDKEIAFYDIDNNIIGRKKGETSVKVIFPTESSYVYANLKVIVKDVKTVQSNFTTSENDLKNKTFTVLGDSISDINVTAYPDKRPTFWCEMLRDRLNMKLYDFAISGSCAGLCKQQSNNIGKDYANYIQGSNVVNKTEVMDAVAKSDYVFLYFGNNDVTYDTNIGDYNDINDDNYKDVESFKGAYTYIINKIKSYNPNVKIVCLSLSYSTWGIGKTTRSELADIVGDIASFNNVKYINIYHLWNESNYQTYNPDGIHPQTSGYELIVDKILNS